MVMLALVTRGLVEVIDTLAGAWRQLLEALPLALLGLGLLAVAGRSIARRISWPLGR